MDYKEYSRQRDIAVKRLKRLSAKGQDLGINVPTVKQLRTMPADQSAKMMRALTDFLETGNSLRKQQRAQQESRRIHYSREEESRRRNKYQRTYRRRRKAREYERPEYPHKYEGYVKALETLNVDIKPSQLPSFFAYMDMRFDQGEIGKEYVIDVFVNDYVKMLKNGYSPDQIIPDFEKFVSNQIDVAGRESEMKGYSLDDFLDLWDDFIG